MSLSIRFLGTSASRPTVERGVSSVALTREGETFLFDCGEGTQRQMMRYHVPFSLADVFFTHMHVDHWLGIVGLLRTMALQGRTEPLRVYGPEGAARLLKKADAIAGERLSFPVEYHEVAPGEAVKRSGYAIVPFAVVHHRTPSLGWAFVEEDRRGRFNPDLARELGIPEGPLWGQIHRGLPVTLPDGRTIQPSVLVGEPRPGRRVVLTGDTRPCDATIEHARDADLLVHEATFSQEEAERAQETGHSTAREAAQVAERAGARRLALTHFSARYSRDASDLEREARHVFAHVVIAKDGMELEVPFREGAVASA